MSQAPAAQGTPGMNRGGSGKKSLARAWFSTVTRHSSPLRECRDLRAPQDTDQHFVGLLGVSPGVYRFWGPEPPGYGMWAKTVPQTFSVTFMTITGAARAASRARARFAPPSRSAQDGDQFDGIFQVDVLDPGAASSFRVLEPSMGYESRSNPCSGQSAARARSRSASHARRAEGQLHCADPDGVAICEPRRRIQAAIRDEAAVLAPRSSTLSPSPMILIDASRLETPGESKNRSGSGSRPSACSPSPNTARPPAH